MRLTPPREGFPASESRIQARIEWTQSKITNKYEAYDNEKELKSLFERTNCHGRTRSRTGAPVYQQATLAVQLQQTMSVSRGKQERNKTQILTRVAAVIIVSWMSPPPGRAPWWAQTRYMVQWTKRWCRNILADSGRWLVSIISVDLEKILMWIQAIW
jgi:hypothetical protein